MSGGFFSIEDDIKLSENKFFGIDSLIKWSFPL